MAANRKKQRPSGEIAKQIARSLAHKAKRIARNKSLKRNTKSPWYIRSKLGNRLRRLQRKVLEVAPDRKPQLVDRISEIENILKL